MKSSPKPKKIKTGKLAAYHYSDQSVLLISTNGVRLKVNVMSPKMFRVRYTPERRYDQDFSYAIFKEDYDKVNTSFADLDGMVAISTGQLECRIDEKSLRCSFFGENGNLLNEDAKLEWVENVAFGGYDVKVIKHKRRAEKFYGLGDKPTTPLLNGKSFELWGTDSYGYGETTDPLYKNIPFYIGIHEGGYYGIFFDNSFRSRFDFGKKKKAKVSFGANGGEINYYFISGSSPIEVAEQYAILTGLPELPPLWALGYHQCKWSYFPEKRVRKVAKKFRKLQIPCDSIYLDIDYMDGFRVFTWDHSRFPDPKQLLTDLKENGFKTVVMIDPGIKIDEGYLVCKEGLEKDYFCKRGDGPLAVGPVWPGYCYFPDFTNPEVRQWWSDFFTDFLEPGIEGVWTDMNEPALFLVDNFVQCERTFPDDVRHDYDGHPCSHRKAHNIYGMQMSRATFDGIKKAKSEKRPFVITRSTYSGGQRFASVWTGDNSASWKHLKIANWQCQSLSVSGFSFCGSDIGGFIHEPSGELYIRWLQLGIFHPFCRTHSSKDFGPQEPWSFGKRYTRLAKQTIEIRYQILAYMYSAFQRYATTGAPILTPLSWNYPEDQTAHTQDEEFMVGKHILVKSVSRKKARTTKVYLPEGSWYSWWNGKKYKGHKKINFNTPLDRFPFFIKAGSVIPVRPVMQYVDEQPINEMELRIYFDKGHHTSNFYEDIGSGMAYKEGLFSDKVFRVTGTKNSFNIKQKRTGNYKIPYSRYAVKIYGLPFKPNTIKVNGAELDFECKNGELVFSVRQSFRQIMVS
ncbi:MAG: glycoside hydrolase family 31 protein [Bacteroidota bacterium]